MAKANDAPIAADMHDMNPMQAIDLYMKDAKKKEELGIRGGGGRGGRKGAELSKRLREVETMKKSDPAVGIITGPRGEKKYARQRCEGTRVSEGAARGGDALECLRCGGGAMRMTILGQSLNWLVSVRAWPCVAAAAATLPPLGRWS